MSHPRVKYQFERDVVIPPGGVETDLLPAVLDVSGFTDVTVTVEDDPVGGAGFTGRIRRTASATRAPVELTAVTRVVAAGGADEWELNRNAGKRIMPTAASVPGTTVHVSIAGAAL